MSPSPSDVTGSLLVSLDVGHGAVPIAKCLVSHQIVSTVACLPVLVEMGKGRHDVCQRAQITLRRVVLLNGEQTLSNMLARVSMNRKHQ